MKKPTKQQYCRFCGTDKGHATAGCTNFREMLRIIKDQDDVINSMSKGQHAEREAHVTEDHLRRDIVVLWRIIRALLDAHEARK